MHNFFFPFRFGEMVKGLEEHQYWEWPSNPASHLVYPLILPLFRSHQPNVLVNLTNWLEIALRTGAVCDYFMTI